MVNLNLSQNPKILLKIISLNLLFSFSICTLLTKCAAVGIGKFYSAVVVIRETHVWLYIYSLSLLFLPRMLNRMQGPIIALHSLTVIECLRRILAAL